MRLRVADARRAGLYAGSKLSYQTGEFKKWISECRTGDLANLSKIKRVIRNCFSEGNEHTMPTAVALAVADLVVGMYLDECRDFEARN